MDADYTSDLGHTLNSRQENYRLTHPDTPDSGTASNPALTGYDTGSNATLGRATLNPPDPVQWSSSGNHRTVTTAEPEPAHTNSRSTEFRPTDFSTPPAANSTNTSPFGTAPATSTSYGTSAPATTASASPFGTAGPAAHAAPAAPAVPAATNAATTSARAASAAPASTIEPQHVMRLLLASHDLDTAATRAESGEGSVADLTRAAHKTRAAAVELIAAWYGGTDHMRNFAEALLQAASETA